jgi:hypothetical protein
MEVSGQLHAPAALPPSKNSWYPLDRWLGGPQSRSPGLEPPIVQPVAHRYNTEIIIIIIIIILIIKVVLIYSF